MSSPARADRERGSVETLQNLQLPAANGQSVPLAAVAQLRLRAGAADDLAALAPADHHAARSRSSTRFSPRPWWTQLAPEMKAFRSALPAGYDVEVGGAVEESAKAQGPIAAVAPLMLFIMATILMIQLQVLPATVSGLRRRAARADRRGRSRLLPSNAPMGFVAILGVLALIGILIRNSVILIVQIEDLRAEGVAPWEAVREATRAPHAADYADRRRRDAGADPDLARSLSGDRWPTR